MRKIFNFVRKILLEIALVSVIIFVCLSQQEYFALFLALLLSPFVIICRILVDCFGDTVKLYGECVDNFSALSKKHNNYFLALSDIGACLSRSDLKSASQAYCFHVKCILEQEKEGVA